MSVFRTSCSSCDSEIAISRFYSRLLINERAVLFAYTCPACQCYDERSISAESANLLASAGIPIEDRTPRRHEGPALTHDDLLDLHELLADDAATWAELDGLTAT